MKKKITNSKELNNYYKMVNTKLQKYSEMNIPVDKVAKYLKPGSENFKNFISEDDDLKDVDGIEVVLRDIIEDTMHAFKDGLYKKMQQGSVKKFEGYSTDINIFKTDITKEDIEEHEMVLSDIFSVSLSYIKIIKEDLHMYGVSAFGKMMYVMVYSEKQLKKIKENILDYLESTIKNKFYSFSELGVDKKVSLSKYAVYLKEDLDKEIKEEDVVKAIAKNHGLSVEVVFKENKTLNSTKYYLFEVNAAKFPLRSATS